MTSQRPGDVTIYAVAESAGVSISTVSLAINHPDRVAASTREKVLAAVDELGFVPKERAVARARRGVGRLAVIAPFSSYPSFAWRLAGILKEATASGMQVCVFDHEDVAMSSAPVLASLPMRGHFDGLIVMSVPVDDAVVARLEGRIPSILVDQRHPRLPSVSMDNVLGGRLGGEHLVSLGHQRIAFVREADRSALESAPGRRRAAGLRDVVGESMVEIVVERGARAGEHVVDALARQDSPVSAVFAENDLLAMQVEGAAARRGMRIPQDLSVMGFDDGPMAQAIGLTSIVAPFEESGAYAARYVVAAASGSGPTPGPVNAVLDVALAVRETTGPGSTTMAFASKHFD